MTVIMFNFPCTECWGGGHLEEAGGHHRNPDFATLEAWSHRPSLGHGVTLLASNMSIMTRNRVSRRAQQ